MQHIENIIIGTTQCSPAELFSYNEEDYVTNELPVTYFTTERYLPRILVDLGIYPSVSEIRRNKPELIKELNEIDFIELCPKKKVKLGIAVGE